MLSGGGTAGHVYPLFGVLEALADLLKEKGGRAQAQWIGSERIESRIVPQLAERLQQRSAALELEFRRIDIRFSWRRPSPSNWGYYREHILPIALGRPFRQAQQLVDSFEPEMMIAAGGYVSAPALQAAQRRGIPYALLQLDNPPGLVNQWFAPAAWRVFCATEGIKSALEGRSARAKLLVTGFPAQRPQRTAAQWREQLGLQEGQRLLVCMGGSLGAGAVRRAVEALLAAVAADPDSRWRQLAVLDVGGERGIRANPVEGVLGNAPRYIPWDYLDDSIGVLQAADFYLGRSGAATVGELLAAGLPSLLIPDRQHADRQQYGNAEALVQRGQGQLLDEREVSGATLLDWLRRVWDRPRLSAMQPSAAQLIAAELHSFVEATAGG